MTFFRLCALRVSTILAVLFLTSCGKKGESADAPAVAKKEESDSPKGNGVDDVEDLKLFTSIDFGKFEYEGSEPIRCKTSLEFRPNFPAPVGHVEIDGAKSEWSPENAIFLRQPGENFNLDSISSAHLKLTENGALAIAIELEGKVSEPVFRIEMGGMLEDNKSPLIQTLRDIKIENSKVYDYDQGGFESVRDSRVAVDASEKVFEVLIPQRVVAEVTNWPAWWIKISLQNSNSRAGFLPASVFSTKLASGQVAFQLRECQALVNSIPTTFRVIATAEAAPAAVSDIAINLVASAFGDIMKVVLDLEPTSLDQVKGRLNSITSIPIFIGKFKSSPRILPLRPESDIESLSHPIALDVSMLADPTISFAESKFRAEALAALSKRVISLAFHADSTSREILSEMFFQNTIFKSLGRRYWLENFENGNFEAVFDPEQLPNSPSIGRKALGRLVASQVSWRALASKILGPAADPIGPLSAPTLKQLLESEIKSDLLSEGWRVWVDREPMTKIENAWGKDAFQDPDGDQLPNYLENVTGTSAANADSDADGWLDGAEFFEGSDAISAARHPEKLIADGSFSDWLTLIPQKLLNFSGAVGTCSGIDINLVGAIVRDKDLFLGAATTGQFPTNLQQIFWEIQVQLPSNFKSLILSSRISGGQLKIMDSSNSELLRTIDRPKISAGMAGEWLISLGDLVPEIESNQAAQAKIRFRILKKNDENIELCDETKWFVPSQTIKSGR